MSQGQKSGRVIKLKDFIDKICKMPINDLEALNEYVTCLKPGGTWRRIPFSSEESEVIKRKSIWHVWDACDKRVCSWKLCCWQARTKHQNVTANIFAKSHQWWAEASKLIKSVMNFLLMDNILPTIFWHTKWSSKGLHQYTVILRTFSESPWHSYYKYCI